MLNKLTVFKIIKPKTREPKTLPVLIGFFQVKKSVVEQDGWWAPAIDVDEDEETAGVGTSWANGVVPLVVISAVLVLVVVVIGDSVGIDADMIMEI